MILSANDWPTKAESKILRQDNCFHRCEKFASAGEEAAEKGDAGEAVESEGDDEAEAGGDEPRGKGRRQGRGRIGYQISRVFIAILELSTPKQSSSEAKT